MRRGKLSSPDRLCPQTGTSPAARTTSAMPSSCAALRGENLPTQATARTPFFFQAAQASARGRASSGVTSTPRWSRPPGRMQTSSPMAKRAGASPGPALRARATRSARPCTRALTARVVPTVTRSTLRRRAGPSGPNLSSRAFSRAASAARTEKGRSSWRVGALAPARMPSGPQSTASVCVPPASIPRNVCAVMLLPPQASLPEMFVCWVVNFRPGTDKQARPLPCGILRADGRRTGSVPCLPPRARDRPGQRDLAPSLRRPAYRRNSAAAADGPPRPSRREAHGGPPCSRSRGQARPCAAPSSPRPFPVAGTASSCLRTLAIRGAFQ